MSRKNFPVEHEGKTYWISRATAVTGFIFAKKDGETYILANKRGSGTPNFQGYWNAPCGYLDYDETSRQGCVRELFEETGIRIDPEMLKFDSWNEDAYNEQNITFRYYLVLKFDYTQPLPHLNRLGSEENEVEDLRWINVKCLHNYDWAFNHYSRINNIYNEKVKHPFRYKVKQILQILFPSWF